MTIEEKMSRNNNLDQIEIGQIIDSVLKGNFGEVLRAMIEGMKANYLEISENLVALSADRTLGRIESLNKLQDRLDYAVEIARQLQEEEKEEKVVSK